MKKIIQSSRVMIALLLLYIAVMAIATVVETKYSTLTARTYFYNSWWFVLLQMLMIINFMAISLKFKLVKQRKWGALVLHYALVVVLCGALVTHLFGREGIMHIREGESSNKLYDSSGAVVATLPFSVTLTDFRLVRYPGSGSPSSYESDVVIDGRHEKIFMNNIVYKDGYRLYQSSYDHDERGTILSVNQDALGTTITYIGYVLLVLGMIMSILHRHSRFRTLLRSLSVVAVMMYGSVAAMAQPKEDGVQSPAEGALAIEYAHNAAVDAVVAEGFGKLLVQSSGGRVQPIDTYSGEILRKIARAKSFEGMSANQILIGMVTAPEIWSRVPMIDNGSRMVAFVDVLDSLGNYRYAEQVEAVYEKPVAERNKRDKDLLKLDERVNIMHALFSGEMLPLFPNAADPTHKWYSPGDNIDAFSGQDSMFVARVFVWFANEVRKGNDEKAGEIIEMMETYQKAKSSGVHVDEKRIEAEIFYNRVDIFKWSAFTYMGLGLIMLVMLIINMLNESKFVKRVVWTLMVLIGVLFLWQTFGIGLRWYISGRAPMSNAYESMVYVSWATALAGVLFATRSKMTLALSAFFAGVILFVTNLNFMDPEITPLVPVLKSYWLMIHVAVITGSYGFFGIGFLLGLTSLVLMIIGSDRLQRQIQELYVMNQLALTVGLVLLTAGTFLGAVWANESWGRYWGWDPKETWALITMIVYTVILHSYFVPSLRSPFSFALMSVVGLASVLMTFFGVNYYLSGLHSYGADSAPPALNLIYVVYGFVAIVAVVAWRRDKVKNSSI